jgi:tricorn protease
MQKPILCLLSVLTLATVAAGSDPNTPNPDQSVKRKMSKGYYRFPTIHGDTVAFTCEDDLWAVSVEGGYARRLTTSLSDVITPHFSTDGQWIAFVAKDEGHPEVYVMPAEGGEPRRLTYQAASARAGGRLDARRQVGHLRQYRRVPAARNLAVARATGRRTASTVSLRTGAAHQFRTQGGTVILGRHTGDPAMVETLSRRHGRCVLD